MLLALLYGTPTQADPTEYFFKYGIGLNNGAFPDTTVKLLSVGQRDTLYSVLDYQLEVGTFSDNSQSNGMIFFASPSIGFRTKRSGLYANFFIGPALMTQSDSRLASIFEFNNDMEVGIRDDKGTSIGVGYKHFSNAGLTQGNLGRDFFLIKLGVSF